MIGVVNIALSKGFAGKTSISCQQPGLPTGRQAGNSFIL